MLKNLCIATAAIVLLLSACKKGGEEEGTTGIKTRPELTVVSLAAMGPYQGAGAASERLFSYLGQNGIETTGPPMGIYYSDPEVVPPESLKYEILAQVDKEVEVAEPFVYKVIPGATVAYTLHKGSYDTLQDTYNALMKYIEDHGYQIVGPALEVYLTTQDEPLTEIQFPVMKK